LTSRAEDAQRQPDQVLYHAGLGQGVGVARIAEEILNGSIHVLTAVCPATGRAERLDTALVQTSFDHLSATVPAGTHVLRVSDGVWYHVAKRLRVPANLTAVGLPLDGPRLNLVKRLWLYLSRTGPGFGIAASEW
jgi:hypothetical protein